MLTVPFLITVLVLALIAFVCFWLIDYTGIPYPINMIAKAIVAILVIVTLLQKSGLLH
jgi:hypothetical protein